MKFLTNHNVLKVLSFLLAIKIQ